MSLNNACQSIMNERSIHHSPKSLEQICAPISNELKLTEAELFGQVKIFASENPNAARSIKHFFNRPGKYLRPALVLLSYKACSPAGKDKQAENKVITLAAAVELIHSASLIHDDIIDKADIRRDAESVNKKYGSHAAVLAGDILYAKSFSMLVETRIDKILKIMCRTTEQMCVGEIDNMIDKTGFNKEQYLGVISRKTASFMSACCECGALLSGANAGLIKNISSYGNNFGMVYQLVDDYIDEDSSLNKKSGVFRGLLDGYIDGLNDNLASLEDSAYKQSLYDLCCYVTGQIKPAI